MILGAIVTVILDALENPPPTMVSKLLELLSRSILYEFSIFLKLSYHIGGAPLNDALLLMIAKV